MHVLATAGHVDHGKSTLVRALTGMEPDRWSEERRRGMTIDLGFAWTTLPSGSEIAFVDVPGHHRFATNMLAGIGAVPAALIVVAADERWRQQTHEHAHILAALGIDEVVVAVTRADLADPEPAHQQTETELRELGIAPFAIVATSASTGRGVNELRVALDRFTARLPPADPTGRVRLWIDRSFSIRGHGTVVTGTLSAGTIAVDDVLELNGGPVRVRGLQSLGRDHSEVAATARVAVNLRGVPADRVRRGDTLLTPSAWWHTDTVDVTLHAGPVEEAMTVHLGSSATPARVRPLGEHSARLTLARELPISRGDRVLLREPSRSDVLFAAVVADADPPALRRRGAARTRAVDLERGRVGTVAAETKRRGAVRLADLQMLGVDERESTGVRTIGAWLVDADTAVGWTQAMTAAVDRHRQEHPQQPGMPLPELTQSLAIADSSITRTLAREAGLRVADGRVYAAAAARTLGDAERSMQAVEQRWREDPFAAPTRPELDELRLTPRDLATAEKLGRAVRLAPDIVVAPEAITQAADRLAALAQPFTVSQAGRACNTTRRVTIPLLERLDSAGITRRTNGDQRSVSR